MGLGMSRIDFKAICDPVSDGSEVRKPAVAAGFYPGELEVTVDGFDGGGCGVVPEVPASSASRSSFHSTPGSASGSRGGPILI